MRKKTKVETRVEMREVWIITKPRRLPTVFCQLCSGQQTTMLAPEAAAKLAGVTLRALFRWVEAGVIHYLEQPDGTLWVCPNSLPGATETTVAHVQLPQS